MSQWINICDINDIIPATGVCALLGSEQVAIFRPRHDEQVLPSAISTRSSRPACSPAD